MSYGTRGTWPGGWLNGDASTWMHRETCPFHHKKERRKESRSRKVYCQRQQVNTVFSVVSITRTYIYIYHEIDSTSWILNRGLGKPGNFRSPRRGVWLRRICHFFSFFSFTTSPIPSKVNQKFVLCDTLIRNTEILRLATIQCRKRRCWALTSLLPLFPSFTADPLVNQIALATKNIY